MSILGRINPAVSGLPASEPRWRKLAGAVASTITESDIGEIVVLVAGTWQLHSAALTEVYMKEELPFMAIGVLDSVDEQAHTGRIAITGPAQKPGAVAGDVWFMDVDGTLTNVKPAITGTKLRVAIGRSWQAGEITVGVFFLSGPIVINDVGGAGPVDPETLRIDVMGTDNSWGAAAGNNTVYGPDDNWGVDSAILWNTVYGSDNAWAS